MESAPEIQKYKECQQFTKTHKKLKFKKNKLVLFCALVAVN